MAKGIYLGLAIHNHQPVGNFPWVFAEAYRTAYQPMLEALERHPGVRLSLHYSGPLLDWLRAERPDFLARLAVLVNRGQVEMMSGAYYEAILPSIPDEDKVGQIGLMHQAVREAFGAEPTGMWVAERVWEPHLPRFLAQAGVQWTVLDDTHFKLAGLEDADLFGYYLTEEQGFSLKVFGTSKHLRYTVPWASVEEVIDYLGSQATEEGTKIAVMGDDGEKFGVWPGTYEHCWRKGWMEAFFAALEAHGDWLHSTPLGEYARRFPALGRIYLPAAAYAEMMEWALPPRASYEFTKLRQELERQGRHEILRFLRAGFWRNFLAKYPEANMMHKKMLRAHRKVYQARALGVAEDQSGLRDLWKGQGNEPYWHGVFGGIYLTHIRTAAYRHLIAAERSADLALRGAGDWLEWERTDFDGDGKEELLVEGSRWNLYLSLAEGGSLWEWDLRPCAHNLVSTLSRRPEAYHQVLLEAQAQRKALAEAQEEGAKTIHDIVRSKEEGLEQFLNYDWYRRSCLLDHFLHPGTRPEEFARSRYGEQGDFINQPYAAAVERQADGGLKVRLWRDGHLWSGQRREPLRVEKHLYIPLKQDQLAITYTLTPLGRGPVEGLFSNEWNFNLLASGAGRQAYYELMGQEHPFASTGESPGVSRLALGQRQLGVRLALELGREAAVWRFPVESVSSSEGGFERVHQGGCLLLCWPFRLEPGESWRASLTWRMEEGGGS